MTASSIFRELSLTPGAALDDKLPAGLNVTEARRGGPIDLRYRVEFLDADDQVIVGGTVESPDPGSMTLQWWAIIFHDAELKTASAAWPWPMLSQQSVRTVHFGGTVGITGGQNQTLHLRGPFWLWPQVVAATPPAVYGKVIDVSIPFVTPDGTYSIQRDDEDPVVVVASSSDYQQIAGDLAEGFDGDPVVTAVYSAGQTIRFSCAAGDDFELTLVSPGSILTQADVAVPAAAGEPVKARMIAQVTGPIIE